MLTLITALLFCRDLTSHQYCLFDLYIDFVQHHFTEKVISNKKICDHVLPMFVPTTGMQN